jgi:hypothetical protein
MPFSSRAPTSFVPAVPAVPAVPSAEAERSPWLTLEDLPTWLICVPLALQWLWLGARFGSVTLPSCANPAITAGGLVGEGKLEYFRGMGAIARAATARHCSVTVAGDESGTALRDLLRRAGIDFPLVAKPDAGLCGYGVRRIDEMGQLQEYLAAFPRGETVVLQEYLPQAGEAGIFYVRVPGEEHGQVISVALRQFPQVTGDGSHSVAQLVASDARARRVLASPRHRCSVDLSCIPAAGEVVRLSTVGSTRVGGLYLDGSALCTPALTAAIDRVARDMPDFHFGRFDVRFDSEAQLAHGTGFRIMEVNGAGSEAIQAWDPSTSLRRGFAAIFAKQRLLFEIADGMRRAGARPIGLLALARLNRRQRRLNARYPASN